MTHPHRAEMAARRAHMASVRAPTTQKRGKPAPTRKDAPTGRAAPAFSHAELEALEAVVASKNSPENVAALIRQECRALEALLLEKNAGYGNSALDPLRVFSKAPTVEQILVRLDDKLSRIKRGDLTKVSDETFNVTIDDIQGYLVLLKLARRLGLV